MAKLIINIPKPPITYKKYRMNYICCLCEDFKILKNQTLGNFEFELKKDNETKKEFFIPNLCNQMLLAITSMNHFLLNINIILERKKVNNSYERILLENIYEHDNKVFKDDRIFKNNLASQFKFLFDNLRNNFYFEESEISSLKEIAKIFIIVESFFRNHQAHGNTNSIIEIFNEYNIGGHLFYIYDKNIITDGNVNFFFTIDIQYFAMFKKNIVDLLVTYKEKISDEKELNRFEKEKNRILLNFNPEFGIKDTLFIKGSLMRTYLKYKCLMSLDIQEALNFDAIEKVLVLNRLISQDDGNFMVAQEDDKISPIHLFEKMKFFIETIETKLLKAPI